jgi:hypothetical protein
MLRPEKDGRGEGGKDIMGKSMMMEVRDQEGMWKKYV